MVDGYWVISWNLRRFVKTIGLFFGRAERALPNKLGGSSVEVEDMVAPDLGTSLMLPRFDSTTFKQCGQFDVNWKNVAPEQSLAQCQIVRIPIFSVC